MAANSQDLYAKNKQIDSLTNMIVFGYIHDFEKVYLNGNQVPIEVMNICLLYFLYFREKFRKNGHGEDIVILFTKSLQKYLNKLHECNTVKKRPLTNGYDSAFATNIVDAQLAPNSIYQWELKANIYISSNRYHHIPRIKVGIASINTHHDGDCFGVDANYGSTLKCYDEFRSLYPQYLSYHTSYIVLILNLNDGTIRYIENGKDYGIEHENVDLSERYQFAVSLSNEKDSVEITDFKIE